MSGGASSPIFMQTAIASTCSFGEGFTRRWRDIQTGFDGTAKPCGKYLDFSPMAVMCFIYRERYKFRGVHWKLATPETSRELPASEATRRTSLSQEPRRRLRTATDIKNLFFSDQIQPKSAATERSLHLLRLCGRVCGAGEAKLPSDHIVEGIIFLNRLLFFLYRLLPLSSSYIVLKCVLVNQRGSHIKIHHTEEDLGKLVVVKRVVLNHRVILHTEHLVDRHRNMPGLLSELLYPAD
ncbi:LOW QUALITY PROTEIN: hypothetical protein YC2023_039089 [Brassica napus]